MSDIVLTKWDEVKAIIAELELDVHKNANGNCAAGVRCRKGFRAIRDKMVEMVKLTVACDRATKEVLKSKKS